METDRFQCYYFPKTFTLFSDIIDHLCRNHKHEIIKYHIVMLLRGYRTHKEDNSLKSVWRLILQSNCKEISSFLVIKISVGETAIYPLKLFPSIVWFDFSEIFIFLSVDQSKYFTKILGKLNKPNLL